MTGGRSSLNYNVRFTVLPPKSSLPTGVTPHAYLITDPWDDWFTYNTQYCLIYRDAERHTQKIGHVKIGQFGMREGRPSLPEHFAHLSEDHFSLGQDGTYYEALNSLGDNIRDEILRGLRDLALDSDLFVRALDENVTGVSLLRSVEPATVEGQFRRLAKGGARLSRYHFVYAAPAGHQSTCSTIPISFDVEPESDPPTNIHVLIGQNGAGKTRLLNHMAEALVDDQASPAEVGYFDFTDESGSTSRPFANLVSISFSAFDSFEPISKPRNKATGLQYVYVGLKRIRTTSGDKPQAPKSPTALAQEFGTSVKLCLQGARLPRWRRALEMLQADPIFDDAKVADLADTATDDDALRSRARTLFRNLSSGHKIVLLTITRLVESVEERSLVLLDEPEAHLHPPLLSAFIRALSDLLTNRNGVAIIATHSPVVLQEVPKRCAWKLRRSGDDFIVEQPEIETFGENVGVLTREVFGLEVTRSGFHRLLEQAVNHRKTYEQIMGQFQGRLGGEAKGIVRALLAAREVEEGT